ncbi:hypothetical protein PCASD_13670 [Puccinia coronata f. sp. avenae]|uniref:endopeptidase La n=1 Tax=Puccinia coronata f. sp. avenae TaxID=200324 RepID=A0A2N5UC15_9BASI|nr:hypothetical protein PCASD_13670 [Puccinia coronata f. sp. avenae]
MKPGSAPSSTLPMLILPPSRILFPHQTLALTIYPPVSIELTKIFLAAPQPVYIGCLPLKVHNQNHTNSANRTTPASHPPQQQQLQLIRLTSTGSSDQPIIFSSSTAKNAQILTNTQSGLVSQAFQWGCIARLISFDHSTATHALKINLVGVHRFKIIRFPSTNLVNTQLTPLHHPVSSLHAQIIQFDDELGLDVSSPLLHQFKSTITRFIILLAHSIQPHPAHPDPKAQIDRLIRSVETHQISFLIDLMIRDIQLIDWEDKLEFLTYFNSQLKLEKFVQLITRISDQIQAFYTQSNFFRPPTTSYDPPAQLAKLPDSNLTLHQKELLIRSRLKAINSQLVLGVEQLNHLYNNHPSHQPITLPSDKPLPFRLPYSRPNNPRQFPRSMIIAPPRRSGMLRSGSPFSDLDSEDDELKDLEKKIHSAGMTQEAFQICSKELKRLGSIQPSSVEHSVIKNYLEVMLELPWSKSTITLTNQAVLAKGFLDKARAQLDLDHFGMLKVKQRLIEFLAVIKLRTDLETRAANQQFIASNADPSTTTATSTKPSKPQGSSESHISRLWKDSVDPTFLVQPDHSPDRPTGPVDHTRLSVPAANKDSSEKKRAPILLLVGPPGVGKTSVARSIAKAMNKKFYRISLGGVKDESEIRGHRRTYVGSMPGTIVQALRRVGVNDPVILLDEIDKVGSRSINGDPASALLEVLDPEQNSAFVDHYINTPIDLSSVLFLATANTTSTISAPLLDRLEIIDVDGYSLHEKMHIAKRNLIPKQIRNYSLQPNQFVLDDDDVLKNIILSYTRESGVRSLEREIGSLCRAKVLEYVQDRDQSDEGKKALTDHHPIRPFSAKIGMEDVRRILGPEQYEMEVSEEKLKPGVAIGMAYQGSGNGSILYIEAASYAGKGGLRLTGSLGDVIKESAELAMSWIKANAHLMNLNLSKLDSLDLHIHFPSGSIKKDGPSAGVGLVLALVSLFSGLPIDNTLAVTGEISLRGQILPVGGIREKVLAASRSGIKRILIPAKNEKEMTSDANLTGITAALEVQYVSSLYDAVKAVFKDQLWATAPPGPPPHPLHPRPTPHSHLAPHPRNRFDMLVARHPGTFPAAPTPTTPSSARYLRCPVGGYVCEVDVHC